MDKIKIGGHTVEIVVKNIGDDCGVAEFHAGQIHIEERLPQTLKESTLFHEILHYINSTFGSTHISHSLQDSLSEQLYQVFKENGFLSEKFTLAVTKKEPLLLEAVNPKSDEENTKSH